MHEQEIKHFQEELDNVNRKRRKDKSNEQKEDEEETLNLLYMQLDDLSRELNLKDKEMGLMRKQKAELKKKYTILE